MVNSGPWSGGGSWFTESRSLRLALDALLHLFTCHQWFWRCHTTFWSKFRRSMAQRSQTPFTNSLQALTISRWGCITQVALQTYAPQTNVTDLSYLQYVQLCSIYLVSWCQVIRKIRSCDMWIKAHPAGPNTWCRQRGKLGFWAKKASEIVWRRSFQKLLLDPGPILMAIRCTPW